MKFYAVKKGRKPGVYRTWEEARKQVEGYSGAEYKSFTKITDATEYLNWDRETVNQVFQKDEDSLQKAIAKIQKESRKIKQNSAIDNTQKWQKQLINYFQQIPAIILLLFILTAVLAIPVILRVVMCEKPIKLHGLI